MKNSNDRFYIGKWKGCELVNWPEKWGALSPVDIKFLAAYLKGDRN